MLHLEVEFRFLFFDILKEIWQSLKAIFALNMNKKLVYLDYAATTPLSLEVKEEMDLARENYGNPSSLHQIGYEAKIVMDDSRARIAKILNCRVDEIIFVSGGTESDNLAILGFARANKSKGNHIVASAIEHHAVLEPCRKLEKEGFEESYLPVSKDGIVDLDELKKALRPETILVSVMYVNNEIGTIQPIKEISQIIRKFNQKNSADVKFHTDACQAAGYLDINVNNLGVDMLTLNAGKIYGPKGSGILYIKKGIKLEPLIFGGQQEFGVRGGTENVVGVIGLARALELVQKNKEKENKRLLQLKKYFIDELFKKITKIQLNGTAENSTSNIVNISVLGIEGESLLLYLDKEGVCISTGSACTSKSLEPSHVILALGKSHEMAHNSIRFTLGRYTKKEDLDYVLKVLPEIVEKLRKISPLG